MFNYICNAYTFIKTHFTEDIDESDSLVSYEEDIDDYILVSDEEEDTNDYVMVQSPAPHVPPAVSTLKAKKSLQVWQAVKPFDSHGWGFIERDLSLRFKKVL